MSIKHFAPVGPLALTLLAIAAAQTVTTHADGSSATSNVFSCRADSCSAIPIDLNGPGERV